MTQRATTSSDPDERPSLHEPPRRPSASVRPRRVLVTAVVAACAALGSSTVADAVASQTAPPAPVTVALDRWVRQNTAGGASYLRVPTTCAARACPLVIVSHPRAQTAERVRDSPQVNVLLTALLQANFAVLLSGDGGPNSWGSENALYTSAAAHLAAIRSYPWNGRTYALGLSMGGLLALRSALPGAPYEVRGVALIDAWVSLLGAWKSAPSRRMEIQAAYGLKAPTLGAPKVADYDPLHLTSLVPPLPLFIVSSPDDKVVPASINAQRLSSFAQPGVSDVVTLSGAHMGGNRFTPAVAGRLVAFLQRLERLAATRGS
ncbi:pimeloyl-ACP methyl ester carboxylesterase [Deinococcus metalli]|uniref:Alpha/beta hydrolase n=1 Tax=Deinococcus metalli TaxID=1141878 RepID=A0A7W8KBK7_9DEIO|nr:alpha/beta hydrolase [Deinococcus metalli]MBB5375167.1 pimeloyl-ACP methyl ester carboxylesterase [Deinococcus metalli]GHF31226.1 alpha/beta hydrolase [Deinococcus metalli]